MSHLLHVASVADLDRCFGADAYAPEAFAGEGFVHCCRPDQLAGVLARYFRDRSDLELLELDEAALEGLLVEESAGGAETFPHVYGHLPWSAILTRRALATDADGTARLGAGPVVCDELRVEHGGLRVLTRREPSCRRYHVRGVVSDDAVHVCMTTLWGHTEYRFEGNELYDLREVTGSTVTSTGVRRLADTNTRMFEGSPNFRSAILVGEPLMFGMSRMYGAWAGDRGDNIQIFRDLARATAWLDGIHSR